MSKISMSTYSFSNALYSDKIPTITDLFKVMKSLGADGVEIVSFNIMNGAEKMSFGSKNPEAAPDPVFPDGSHEQPKEKAEKPAFDPEAFMAMKKMMDEAANTRPVLMDEIKAALKETGLVVSNMPVDFGDIGALDDEKRRADIEMLKGWMDIAAELGSPSIRVNSGYADYDEQGNPKLDRCCDAYRELAEYGEKIGVMITMENHGGITMDPAVCKAIYEKVNHPNFQLIPDFGNFHIGEAMYDGIETMFTCGNPPCVHVKTYAFDDDKYGFGRDCHTDFYRMAEIVKKHNYDGWYSVECNGACGPDYANVRETVEIIHKVFGA